MYILRVVIETRLHLVNLDQQCGKLFQVLWKRIVRIFRAVLSDTASSTCQDLRFAVSAYVIIPSRCGAKPSTVRHRMWVSGNVKDNMRVTWIWILEEIKCPINISVPYYACISLTESYGRWIDAYSSLFNSHPHIHIHLQFTSTNRSEVFDNDQILYALLSDTHAFERY